MRKVVIAFDCDGTLVTTESAATRKIVDANEKLVKELKNGKD